MPVIDELAAIVAERSRAASPVVVGITGPVAVGKTTLTAELAAAVEGAGLAAVTLSADAFLLPNEDLGERGLLMQKGFPETFDLAGLRGAVETLRRRQAATVPVYSHELYDRVPGASVHVEPAAVVIVEGVVVLNAAVADLIDIGVYLDAEEADIVEWFTGRFLLWRDGAGRGEGGFYAMFAGLTDDECRALARATWDGINGVNLRDHIAPSRAHADVVLRKGPRHDYRGLDPGPRSVRGASGSA